MIRPLNSSGVSHVGNDRFEGYCADLAKKLFDIIHMDYTIELVNDVQYGSMTKTGSWNGMVGELVRGVSGHDNTQVRGAGPCKDRFFRDMDFHNKDSTTAKIYACIDILPSNL